MKRKIIALSVLFVLLKSVLIADEGMWIPLLISKYNISLMQEKGFKLSADDIYSINKASMKDAVVLFGSGCTGEIISPEGLLITNHHCGFSQIQRHSTLENDYLRNGFWAMSNEQELPNPGLSVTILKRMEDVTGNVLNGVTDNMSPQESNKIIESNILKIRTEAIKGTHYTATVRPFYMGNQYFLFVNETFTDVRLVGAPPTTIGSFGGDTDNWIWPRHTGDFSMFRIYAGKDNKPASYSKDNVPYKPAYHFPVSLKGVNEGDFTMVFGYPGTTIEYVPSYHIDMVKNTINPRMIDLRGAKLEIIDEAMNSDPLVRIQYSAKKASVSNAWKKWIGENQGLERMKTIEKKQEFEKQLSDWVNADQKRKEKYGNVLPRYAEIYKAVGQLNLVNTFTNDAFFSNGAESVGFSRGISQLIRLVNENGDSPEVNSAIESMRNSAKSFFRNYNMAVDQKLFVAMMNSYGDNIPEEWQADEYKNIKNECNGDFQSCADKIFAISPFTDEKRFDQLLIEFSQRSTRKVLKDPLYRLGVSANNLLAGKVREELAVYTSELQALNKTYMTMQMEFQPGKVFYPDANSTLRVAYGTVQGYDSRDGIRFRHSSTLKGIIEKDNPEIYDYDVPDKLKDLYLKKDYGDYAVNGEVPVCFIANNHTTGGNSGSPVINADGHLIGINFDRAWEGVASDMVFNPDQSRNISLDIRYALFIIDKFAGAGYLLEEMTIIR